MNRWKKFLAQRGNRIRAWAKARDAEDLLHAGKPKYQSGDTVVANVPALKRATNADYTGYVGAVLRVTSPNPAGHRYLVRWTRPDGGRLTSEVNERHLRPTGGKGRYR